MIRYNYTHLVNTWDGAVYREYQYITPTNERLDTIREYEDGVLRLTCYLNGNYDMVLGVNQMVSYLDHYWRNKWETKL